MLSKSIPRPQREYSSTKQDSKHSTQCICNSTQSTQYAECAECVHISSTKETQSSLQDAYTQIVQIDSAAWCTQNRTTIIVATQQEMQDANRQIEQERVVAVDVKIHTFRTYRGFVCYIVVQTHNKVYIYDMLSIGDKIKDAKWIHDASIAKVMHKAQDKNSG